MAFVVTGSATCRLGTYARVDEQGDSRQLVTGFEHLVDGLDLPDPNDRHVLAAAVRAGAQVIVAMNLKDFPAAKLKPYGVEAIHPDDFLLDEVLGPVAG